MTSTTIDNRTATNAASDRTVGRVTWTRGLVTGVVAAATSTAVAAGFHLADNPLTVVGDGDGETGAVPLAAFALWVLIGTAIGIVIARRASRRTFVRTTVVLTALSLVPSLAWGETAADKVGLVVTHLVAAAIVIPRIARR